jgi:GGDEF domain-containing protein
MNENKTFLGLRSSAVFETLILLLVFVVMDFVVNPGLDGFFDASPHPLWVVVLFVTVQYGTAEGLFAALASSALYLLTGAPEQTVAMDKYDYWLHLTKNPIMWIFFSVLLGELVMRHLRSRNHWRQQTHDIQVQADTISDNYEKVRAAKERLEVRVAGQFRSTLQAYKAAKEIEKLHPADVLQGVQEIISSVLSPEKFSVWLLSNDGMDTTVTYGWRDGDALPSHISSESELYRQVIGKQQVVHVANSDFDRVLANQGVIAGPLYSRETGEIVGMLKIERMSFADLNLSTIETFRTICEWVATAFVHARRYQEAKADTVYNPDHNLMTFGYFQRYTDYISSLAKRLRFDVNMVVVRLVNGDSLSSEARATAARHLGTAVNDVLRAVDLAFDYHKTGEEYSIVLPATDRKGADIVVEKIKRAVAQQLPESGARVDYAYTVHTVHQA